MKAITLCILVIAVLVSVLFVCCQGSTKPSAEETKTFPVLNFEDMLKVRKEMKLSEIASDIQYVKLELKSGVSIVNNPAVLVSDKFIFVYWYNTVLQFGKDGKFIRTISKQGKGPKEFLSASFVSVNEEAGNICIHGLTKILIYSFQGEFVKEIPIPADYSTSYIIDSNHFLGWRHVGVGNENNVFALLNQNGKVLDSVKNNFNWPVRDLNTRIGWSDYNEFYTVGMKIFFKDMYTDTVYTVSEQNKITPVFFLNLGKFKIPDNHRPSYATNRQQMKELSKGYMWANVQESERYIFINSRAYSEKKRFLILRDKQDQSSVLVSDDPEDHTGFINDIDGGTDFWPWHINGVWMYDMLKADEFLEIVPDKLKMNAEVKYPDKKAALKDLAATVNEEDN
ncbi:MAG TPA: 6-bladed beta-propeller, partial [Bacteroidales bacterium]|nr:6-bladed beta-propeller [Bacteroidales bacterium]